MKCHAIVRTSPHCLRIKASFCSIFSTLKYHPFINDGSCNTPPMQWHAACIRLLQYHCHGPRPLFSTVSCCNNHLLWEHTVNPEIFARILFSRITLKDLFAKVKIATKACFTIISRRQRDFAISRGFYFHETSQMRSFAKLKLSRKFPNLQYSWYLLTEVPCYRYLLTAVSRSKHMTTTAVFCFRHILISDSRKHALHQCSTCCVCLFPAVACYKPLLIEPVHEISNNVVCATSKASDQPAHTRSLIRAFASRLNIL